MPQAGSAELSAAEGCPDARLLGVHGLEQDTDLSPFIGCSLQVVSIGLHQVNLGFNALRNIGIAIEGDYAVATPGAAPVLYSIAPSGANALAGQLGVEVTGARVVDAGTTIIQFADGTTLSVFDSESHYESYQISMGDRLIVV